MSPSINPLSRSLNLAAIALASHRTHTGQKGIGLSRVGQRNIIDARGALGAIDVDSPMSKLALPAAPEGPNLSAHYRAFISYSHVDERAASRLHRKLENYTLPTTLPAATGRISGRFRKLSPIFRDRNELAASTSLRDEVIGALSDSACLVVLCSPAARASHWVDQEISLFRSLHPDRPVLAALIEGEPNEAFPAALTAPGRDGAACDPVAADFRSEADGPKLAFLKIVAGICGVKLDHLVQRDAQRQLHRALKLAAVSATLAVLLLTLLLMAINARREAENRRQQAEGLVEFMLTDLRARLEGVGRLDVMNSVNSRAFAYYGEQGDLSRLSSDALERRARVLHAMGEDEHRQGDLKSALARFLEAHRTTGALVAAAPDDPTRVFSHAQSEFWLGYTDFLQQRYEKAQPRFEQYRRLAHQLTRMEPQSDAYLRELGYAEGNLCSLELAREAGPEATIPSCRRALETMKRVAISSPNDAGVQLDLANRHAWLADALRDAGRVEMSLRQRHKQAAILDRLIAKYPENAGYLQDWLLSRFALAVVLRDSGSAGSARHNARAAHEAISKLVARDPKNRDWQHWRSKIEEEFSDEVREE